MSTNRYWQTLQGLQNEITDNTPVVHVHSRPKCVEYSGHTDRHIFLQLHNAHYCSCTLILIIIQMSHCHASTSNITADTRATSASDIQFKKHQNPKRANNRQLPITSTSHCACILTKAVTLQES